MADDDPVRQYAYMANWYKERHGWTVRELAKRSGVPVMTVHRAVTRGNVMLSSALAIAAALGMDTGDLAEAGRP